jgi:glycosyltransferase involved in cell wall biosynthesis
VRRGIAVRCIVAAVAGPGRAELVDGVEVVRVGSLGTVLSQPLAPGFPLAVRRAPGDLVHLHHPNVLGDLAAVTDRRRPLVITQHSDVVRQRALRPLYGPLVRAALRRARFVVAASEPFLRWSSELRPFVRKARVIPYGIDPAPFAATPEVEARARVLRAGWPGGKVVLAVGRLVRYKGHEVLIRAARDLDATVVIIGTGPEAERLRALAGPRTVLAGAVSEADLPAYYRAADAFCLPSLTPAEAFGIVLLEAMACGLPLVTTALPTGVTAVNRDGVTGLVVPPGDAGALKEALAALLDDGVRRAAMGEAARRVQESEYTATLMGERYLELYREALG